jgi:hypothetical protein
MLTLTSQCLSRGCGETRQQQQRRCLATQKSPRQSTHHHRLSKATEVVKWTGLPATQASNNRYRINKQPQSCSSQAEAAFRALPQSVQLQFRQMMAHQDFHRQVSERETNAYSVCHSFAFYYKSRAPSFVLSITFDTHFANFHGKHADFSTDEPSWKLAVELGVDAPNRRCPHLFR